MSQEFLLGHLTRRNFLMKARDISAICFLGKTLGCTGVSIPGAPHIYIPNTEDINDVIGDMFDADPNRVVAVRIEAEQSSFISYNNPDVAMGSELSDELRLGDFYSEIGACIPFIQFKGLEKISSYYVDNAHLIMKLKGFKQGDGTIESFIQRLGGNWNAQTLTWNNSADVLTAGFISGKYEHPEPSLGEELAWDLQAMQYDERRKLVRGWMDEPENNYGISLSPVSPSESFRIFDNSPRLEIELRKQV